MAEPPVAAPPLIDPARSAVFLDIDGTLIDLAETPDSVVVPPDLPDLLDRLRAACGGALALNTGRPLADVDRLLPARFDVSGGHGSHWRLNGAEAAISVDERALAAAIAFIERRFADRPGVLLEPKPQSLAIHFRQAHAQERAVWQAAEEARAMLGPGFRLMAGKFVVEVVARAIGKGTAIERFLAVPPYEGRQPVFAGDDVSDEHGFAAVNAAGGWAIRIGAGQSAARYRLPSPDAVRAWLAASLARHERAGSVS